MERNKTILRVGLTALTALIAAGMIPHSALADSDKGKGKKNTPVIIGPITTTSDPPKKK